MRLTIINKITLGFGLFGCLLLLTSILSYFGLSGSGNGNQLLIGGLPFAPVSNNYAPGTVDFGEGGVKGNYARVEGHTSDQVAFYYPSENNNASRLIINGNSIGDNYLIFHVVYQTAS